MFWISYCTPISTRMICMISPSILIMIVKDATAKRRRFSSRHEYSVSEPDLEHDM
jgi:hypothetical protein